MILLMPILVPTFFALLVFLVSKKDKWMKEGLSFIAVTINLVFAIEMFGKNVNWITAWGGFGFDFSLRLYHFSSFILLAVSGFSFLVVMYSMVFMRGKEYLKQYYGYLLITTALVSGAVLANNLVVMLFFWEALLLTLFGMIMIGGKKSFHTAVKAVIISGVADLCLMLGIGMTIFLSNGVSAMDQIRLPIDFWGGFAFILMVIGAIAKAGSMPFHSWIPDASKDAPLPFMAFLPAALEKLLGIYLLARICLDLFIFKSGTPMSVTLMAVGAITILLAVMMALIQKDFKKLLSYHAISQVGYMILGIGTALPIGIIGGLFHMINHAMYKSCLFLTAGSVEKQAGATDLKSLGGLGRKMPITFTCFLIAAAAISGVPPFNGFFSKELIFDAALETNIVFYLAALLGAFLTAASFLKLGHSAFLGRPSKDISKVKEASWPMLVPMIIIASGCVLFGVANVIPLKLLIEPIMPNLNETFSGLPHTWTLVAISIVVLGLSLLNHIFGVKRTKSALGAVDHIHYAPGLKQIYAFAEKGYFDPYNIGMAIVNASSKGLWYIDRGIDWIYNGLTVYVAKMFSYYAKKLNAGNHVNYIAWSLVGMVLIVIYITVL